ncbi:MAG: carbon-nitrogen hydrolase family protein [Bacillota bacterium]|jgi:predicted amidohydrolase
MLKDVLTVSVVTFNAEWGEKEKNLNRIRGYIECAAKRGSDMIVFPEMVLTSYDDIAATPKPQKMQTRLAEEIPGPTTAEIAALTQKLGIYAFMGMPEKDKDHSDTIYNALAVFSPEGLVGSYRKMHLPSPEPSWATRGDKPLLVATPWGPVGVAICYDSYCFPEMLRYYVAKGARLVINSTALAHCHGRALGRASLEPNAFINGVFIASANLGGRDVDNYFWGGSSILGPSRKTWEPHYYAGMAFDAPGADEEAMYTATIDLALATRALAQFNPAVGSPDFRPEKYIAMYSELLKEPSFQK